MHELYPSKEALDAAGTGAADAMVETFAQLDELLVTLGASVGRMKSSIAVGRVRLRGFNRTGIPRCVLYWKAGVGRLPSGGWGSPSRPNPCK